MTWLSQMLAVFGLRPTLGRRGERVASKHLRSQGYRILARNLRNGYGEIDVLAEAPDRRTIVVVEVKAGACSDAAPSTSNLRPEVHVNGAKQRKLAALAGQMVRRYGLADRPIRFDVVGIDFPPTGSPRVRHHVGAFESRF